MHHEPADHHTLELNMRVPPHFVHSHIWTGTCGPDENLVQALVRLRAVIFSLFGPDLSIHRPGNYPSLIFEVGRESNLG